MDSIQKNTQKNSDLFVKDIINFYEKVNESKKISESHQTNTASEPFPEPFSKTPSPLNSSVSESKPISESIDPFQKFIFKLANEVKNNQDPIKQKQIKQKQIKEAIIKTIESIKVKPEEPEQEELIIEQAKEKPKEKELIKQKVSLEVKQTNGEEISLDSFISEKTKNNDETTLNEENLYVKELKLENNKASKNQKKLEKITDPKAFIAKQVEEKVTEQINKLKQQFSNFGFTGGGGGTNAVQYAAGGTMDGDLNVTGKYLSAGKDLFELLSSSGSIDRLVSNGQQLLLNSNGTITLPLCSTLLSPDGELLNLKSEDETLGAFSKIVLSPYGFFAYDQNSNSITFNSSDNDITLTTVDEHEWKFNSEGILTGPGNKLTVTDFETLGVFLSSGKDLSSIIFEQSPYGMWLSEGNTGTEEDFLNSLRGDSGINGADGVDGVDGVDGIDGLSSYQIWLSEGNIGTVEDFLNSLVGPQGLNGADNYQLWLSAGNAGTLNNFLSSIKGEQGNTGLTGDSAYSLWLLDGNSGTITDFLSSLRGDKGDVGDTVTDTDYLTEGNVNLFFRSDRVVEASPVKSVNTKTGDVVIGIDDIANLTTTLNSKQVSGNYVELVDGLIPSAYIPGSVDEIQEYTNFDSLTSTGSESSNVLYITTNNNKIYRWGGTVYVEIVGSPGSTDSITEGAINKYFTIQRASDAAPVQSVANKTGDVSLVISDIENLTTSLTSTNTITTAITAKLPTGVSFGSYTNNSVIPLNTPFETILRNMLTTRVAVVYQMPTLSVTYGSLATAYEIGSTIPSFTITPTYTQRDGGAISAYSYIRSGSVLGSGNSYTTSPYQITSTTTFQVSATYNEGPIYNDNLGTPDNNNIKAGSLTNTKTVNALYPYFYGKSSTQPTAVSIAASIQAGTATKVVADASGTVSINYNANSEFLWFAHLGTQTTKQKWFITTLNSGDIGSGSLFNTPVPQNVTSPDGYWANVQYKVYVGGYATATTLPVELRNS